MLLTIDIGNTSIALGLFNGKQLNMVLHMESSLPGSIGAYNRTFKRLFRIHRISFKSIDGVITASVVPELTRIFNSIIKKNSKAPHLKIGQHVQTGISLKVDKPGQVGADRIVNAVAASALYNGPSIIVDFGTATTFDCVVSPKVYIGGVIAPGPDLSAKALNNYTALLPLAHIRRVRKIIGKNTVACIESGLYYGYRGLIKEILAQLKMSMPTKTKVFATGGLCRFWAEQVPGIHYVVPHLTLRGLKLVWDMNRRLGL